MNLLSHIPTCKRYYKSSAKTLVISFIGFQTQKVDVKSNVNVVLKSDADSQVLPQLLKMKKSLAAKLLT